MWENYVLFIDGEAIVIDKPAGLAVHPGSATRESLEDYLHHFRFGFQREPREVPALLLGSLDISPLEAAQLGWPAPNFPLTRITRRHSQTSPSEFSTR